MAFAEDVVSDTQTETDVRQLEGKHKMTLQQMKEKILGQVSVFKKALPVQCLKYTPSGQYLEDAQSLLCLILL